MYNFDCGKEVQDNGPCLRDWNTNGRRGDIPSRRSVSCNPDHRGPRNPGYRREYRSVLVKPFKLSALQGDQVGVCKDTSAALSKELIPGCEMLAKLTLGHLLSLLAEWILRKYFFFGDFTYPAENIYRQIKPAVFTTICHVIRNWLRRTSFHSGSCSFLSLSHISSYSVRAITSS